MTAFNIVRFKVQPGQQDYFIEAHRKARPNFKGFRGGVLVQDRRADLLHHRRMGEPQGDGRGAPADDRLARYLPRLA